MPVAVRVYALTAKIPVGKVTTYGALARAAGTSPRYVGYLMKMNHSKAVPCHRVVGSDGRLVGFNRGLQQKRRFLLDEGVEVKKGKVELRKFLHRFSSS